MNGVYVLSLLATTQKIYAPLPLGLLHHFQSAGSVFVSLMGTVFNIILNRILHINYRRARAAITGLCAQFISACQKGGFNKTHSSRTISARTSDPGAYFRAVHTRFSAHTDSILSHHSRNNLCMHLKKITNISRCVPNEKCTIACARKIKTVKFFLRFLNVIRSL